MIMETQVNVTMDPGQPVLTAASHQVGEERENVPGSRGCAVMGLICQAREGDQSVMMERSQSALRISVRQDLGIFYISQLFVINWQLILDILCKILLHIYILHISINTCTL